MTNILSDLDFDDHYFKLIFLKFLLSLWIEEPKLPC